MAAEYNRIPSGSLVSIFSHTGKCIAQASLLEEFTVSINSEFVHIVDSVASDAQARVDQIFGALKTSTNGIVNYSTQFKQMGASVWRSTDNFVISGLSLEFHYTYNAREEVLKQVEALCEIVLPGEHTKGPMAGNLMQPGPSAVDALKATIPNTIPTTSNPKSITVEEKDKDEGCDTYVNIVIGNMMFLGYVITAAEPTFSKYRDESGAPIYARVSITARSIYTATKQDMRSWIT